MKALMDLMSKADAAPAPLKRSGDNTQVEGALDDDTNQLGFESAAQDAYHALKSGDESGFRDALQAAIEMAR